MPDIVGESEQLKWEAPTSVLLVGEATSIRSRLARMLGLAGFMVFCEDQEFGAWRAHDCSLVFAIADSFDHVMKICVALRRDEFLGALLVTSPGFDTVEHAALLDAGADDVVAISAESELLVARLRAVQRRLTLRLAQREPHPMFVASGKACGVVVRGRTIALTPIETRILSALLQKSGGLVSLKDLRRIGSPDAPLSASCLPVHMTQLRKKLGSEGWRIRNERGIGYLFVDGEELKEPLEGRLYPGDGARGGQNAHAEGDLNDRFLVGKARRMRSRRRR